MISSSARAARNGARRNARAAGGDDPVLRTAPAGGPQALRGPRLSAHGTAAASRRGRRFAVAVALCAVAGAAGAAPIAYTLSGRASGTLGATGFVDALFVVTATADTSAVLSLAPGIPCNDSRAATFAVGGVGAGVIITPVSVADNATWQLIALSRGRCADLGPMWLNGRHRQFETYDLTGAVGPVPLVMPSAPPGVAVQTSQGVLVVSRLYDATFEARAGEVRAVPAATGPGLALLTLALAAAGAVAAVSRRARPPGRARGPC